MEPFSVPHPSFLSRQQRETWVRSLTTGDAVDVTENGRVVWEGVVVRVTRTGIIKVRHHSDPGDSKDLKSFDRWGYQRGTYIQRRLEQPDAAKRWQR